MSNLTVLTDENSQEFVEKNQQAGKLLVIDCYADWCGPCQMYAPVFEEVSSEYSSESSIEFVKANADYAPWVLQSFWVRGIPTTVILKDNKIVFNQSWIIPGKDLKEVIESLK